MPEWLFMADIVQWKRLLNFVTGMYPTSHWNVKICFFMFLTKHFWKAPLWVLKWIIYIFKMLKWLSSLPLGVNFETHLNGGPQGTPIKLRENTANNAANKKNYTPQTNFPHAANKTPARCKQNSCTLQTKFHHATNKIIKRCKKKSHTANNTSARCKQRNYTLQKSFRTLQKSKSTACRMT